jgi:Tol biopolymer transport system component/DNA-binding winged helix-turn-helix (wHTH) protein
MALGDMGNQAGKFVDSGGVVGFGASGPTSLLRFGMFEVDLRAGELRRNGAKVKLQEQPFQLLTQLLERPGEVITREELRTHLWPADTFVDFDHSLNAAVRRLRDALGDSAENPTFVETVARRGYRFLAPVTSISRGDLEVAETAAPEPQVALPARRFRSRWLLVPAAVLILLLGVRIGIPLGAHISGAQSQTRTVRLTFNPYDIAVRSAAISPDGNYLLFSDQTGFYLRQINSGETHSLSLPTGDRAGSLSWFPDSAHAIVSLYETGSPSNLWEMSVLGGSMRRLNEGWGPSVSPDGARIAFIVGTHMHQEIWLEDADGSQARKLVGEMGDGFGAVAWSADSTHIAYTHGREVDRFSGSGEIDVLDVRSPQAAPTRVNFAEDISATLRAPLAWTSDGRLIFTLSEAPPRPPDSNLWAVRVSESGRRFGFPVRLTSDAGSVLRVSASAKGNRIVYLKGSPQPDVYVARIEPSGALDEPDRLTLDDRQDMPYDWTVDGKDVIFTSDRTGILSIYRQTVGQTVPELLVRNSHPMIEPRFSPDGTQILFVEYPEWGENDPVTPLMRVPLVGGAPQKVLEDNWISNHQCAREPATQCLVSIVKEHTLNFHSYDPFKGKGPLVYQIKDDLPQMFNWSLSPDGKTLATSKAKSDEGMKIRLVSLPTLAERTMAVQGAQAIRSLDWAADSRSIWATTLGEEENALVNIDLEGHARVVWRPKNKSVGWAIPSRDGKYLAINVSTDSGNVWMLERP